MTPTSSAVRRAGPKSERPKALREQPTPCAVGPGTSVVCAAPLMCTPPPRASTGSPAAAQQLSSESPPFRLNL